jgi:Tol biopolymer transport system component
MSAKSMLVWAGCALASWGAASAQVTRRISVDSAWAEGNGPSQWVSMSPDARWFAFTSSANNLVPGDSNGSRDVFVRDRQTGTTECVSVDSSGVQGNADSFTFEGALISASGRFVAFTSGASNLVVGDTNGVADVFVRDRSSGTTELVSVASNGSQGDDYSIAYAITPDGRFVAFYSASSNLVAGGWNGQVQVYLRDRQLGTTVMASLDPNGAPADGYCGDPSLSADGRFVAFYSVANNLAPGGTVEGDVYVRDLQAGTIERASVNSGGVRGNAFSFHAYLSADGRYVQFTSAASNLFLAGNDQNGSFDVFLRDRQNATTELVSVAMNGGVGNWHSYWGAMSADARFVTFMSDATDLVPGDSNSVRDIFVRDRQTGTTELVSVNSGGGASNIGSENDPKVSDDGRYAAFSSFSTNLVPMDTNASEDVFLRDRQLGSGTTAFASLCDPGVGGVIACPCSNPPSGPGRGCDNSSATGGASLSASGNSELSADGVVFSTTGEQPSALSILAQGSAVASSGIVYGQGVRCLTGTIRRLFTNSAVGGATSMPDFPAGDAPVSVRSALKGDVISPGQSRWYLVYYRDPTVLGGCSATSTFNATQTGRIDWSF